MSTPLLSACLIVRDEADRLEVCLDALDGLVDEVVVHDTGSTDGSLDLLRRRDVVLIEGEWGDDFATARNTALEQARGEWVLSVDADEVAQGDAVALRALLGRLPGPALLVSIVNVASAEAGGDVTSVSPRLFRRDGAVWRGRVHERVEHPSTAAATPAAVPEEVLRLQHEGYATVEALAAKGRRNARLAERALGELLAAAPRDDAAVARTCLALGRACVGAGERQRAVDAFEAVRELTSTGTEWQQATDVLTRVLLGAGEAAVALALAEQLLASGAERAYCDWLRAQALAQLGDAPGALDLLDRVDRLVDPAGQRYGLEQVAALRVLCEDLARASR
ncbi:glycosyltransferase family 2 protein [Kineococcus arenarius]|uniref:glycosyltransferase family 2 protein n=1 Tax=unclassified Kineococcus TaxID=2621656 RepID=UPI003D7C7009